MLCRSCRRQVDRGALFCARCGSPQARGMAPALDLVIGDARVPLTQTITLGRGEECDVTLDDPSVSRRHARVLVSASHPEIEDAGSSHGTLVDDRPVKGRARLQVGSVVRLGDTRIQVERRPDRDQPAGRTVMLDAIGGLELSSAGVLHDRALTPGRPRLGRGSALKQMDEDEGDQRWVLRGGDGGDYLRMGDDEARLIRSLAAGMELEELLAESEQVYGASGPGRLARLLADLGEHGMLEQTTAGEDPFEDGPCALQRLFTPREWAFSNPDRAFQAAYRWGGWLLFSLPGLVILAAVAAAGALTFLHLALTRHGTPFVVAHQLGWGAAAFLLGRLVVVAVHELGHGLTVASYGRRVRRAGVKLILIFPFAFVDTSDAWFEPRRHRIAVTAAGPATDLILAGTAALVSAGASGTWADLAYQVALGGYIGGLFNLNPLLDRDGYHILVDLLRQPGLRARSRQRLAMRLAGRQVPPGMSRVADLYAVAALAWLLGCAGFAILMSTRYYSVLTHLAGHREIVWGLFGIFYAMLFLPIALAVGKPLLMRRRG